jgi:hypothetical protein
LPAIRSAHLDNLQGSTGATQEASDDGDLAQSIRLGGGVVSVGSGRGDEVAGAGLLLGASRLVILLVLGIGVVLRLLVIVMLGCWNGGGGFLGLGFLVIGIPRVAQPFQGLRGSLK